VLITRRQFAAIAGNRKRWPPWERRLASAVEISKNSRNRELEAAVQEFLTGRADGRRGGDPVRS